MRIRGTEAGESLTGVFKKAEGSATTREEREGQWTRKQVMQHWRTIPDGMKLQALSMATEDQLRVMGWELPNPHDRFLAIMESKQRRDRPDLYRKIEETGELSPEEFEQWTAPLRDVDGRGISGDLADEKYQELFGPVE
jgi:hypothetical protein